MKTYTQKTRMDIKEKISLLWIVVMINMAFADICSFVLPGSFGDTSFKVTPEIMLIFAVLLEIPIAMIFLSRVLGDKANRWINILASSITILYVTIGGSPIPHYIFFATIEVAIMLLIIHYSWKCLRPDFGEKNQLN